jgi:hypothetical protein
MVLMKAMNKVNFVEVEALALEMWLTFFTLTNI